jgi:phosphate-selective porin OprO/OprP
LDAAFPDLDGSDSEIRRLRLEISTEISDFMTFRGQFDFSDGLNIQDLWVSFSKIPRFNEVKVGHFKEPFSLEVLTSSQSLTFMEGSLATTAFAPKRNLGIQIQNTEFYKRLSWTFGAFLDIVDLDEDDKYFEAVDSSAGLNLTSRITGVPWYEDGGAKLLHLGLSYSHQFRDDTDTDSQVSYSTRPESYITNDKLVDTDAFYADGVDLICLEAGLVSHSLSFQAEYFRAMIDSDEEGDPEFWGCYVYGSYFISGEGREYVISKGTFTPEMEAHGFRHNRKGWGGAWEIALRYSYIDLNDENIEGGKEWNFTAGLNWYFLNKHRLMINYVRADVEDRLSPFVDDGSADIFQLRFQLSF